ncbi:MAG: hypothetical protein ABW040_05530 [Microbacteriaceae bacterium]
MSDVLLTIAEVGSDAPRDHRPEVRDAAQASHHALFDVPADDPVPGVDRGLRHLVAARAARLEGDGAAAEFYLAQADAADAASLVHDGADGAAGVAASRRVRAALRYVDLLVERPAAATADDLNGLVAAGWSPAEIVVIGQIVGLVSYQVRVAQGLRILDDVFGEDEA